MEQEPLGLNPCSVVYQQALGETTSPLSPQSLLVKGGW